MLLVRPASPTPTHLLQSNAADPPTNWQAVRVKAKDGVGVGRYVLPLDNWRTTRQSRVRWWFTYVSDYQTGQRGASQQPDPAACRTRELLEGNRLRVSASPGKGQLASASCLCHILHCLGPLYSRRITSCARARPAKEARGAAALVVSTMFRIFKYCSCTAWLYTKRQLSGRGLVQGNVPSVQPWMPRDGHLLVLLVGIKRNAGRFERRRLGSGGMKVHCERGLIAPCATLACKWQPFGCVVRAHAERRGVSLARPLWKSWLDTCDTNRWVVNPSLNVLIRR